MACSHEISPRTTDGISKSREQQSSQLEALTPPGFRLEGFGIANDRRAQENDEIVLFIPNGARFAATVESDFQPFTKTALALRMRQSDEGWTFVGVEKRVTD
jgi:hypothetical protein